MAGPGWQNFEHCTQLNRLISSSYLTRDPVPADEACLDDPLSVVDPLEPLLCELQAGKNQSGLFVE